MSGSAEVASVKAEPISPIHTRQGEYMSTPASEWETVIIPPSGIDTKTAQFFVCNDSQYTIRDQYPDQETNNAMIRLILQEKRVISVK